MRHAKPPLLDSFLCFDIYAANLALGRVYKPLLDQLGVTYPQFLVLVSLWDDDGQSVGSISAGLGLDSSTLTPMLKRLEIGGLVARRRDPADERRVIVTLTKAGQALREPGQRILDQVEGWMGMDRAQVELLMSRLRQLRRNLATAVPG